jgi:hypothetical protein
MSPYVTWGHVVSWSGPSPRLAIGIVGNATDGQAGAGLLSAALPRQLRLVSPLPHD